VWVITVNVAVTARAWSMVNWQALPPQAPLQPPNAVLAPELAVRVTTVPGVKLLLHAPDAAPEASVQLIPAGLLVMVPLPLPEPAIERTSGAVNVAVTCRVWSIVTEQGPVPVHAPVHPANALFAAGDAVSTTTVP
jgi:hypothetical protein